jgi:outer membrane lipoprotein-sorting protein
MNSLLLTLILLLGGQAGALADAANDALPGVFRNWLAAQKNAPDMRVEFTIIKTMPALKEPVKSGGRFWNYANGRFRWETGKPATSVLVYDGVTLQSWEATENQWHKLNPNNRNMRLWMDFLGGQNLTESGLLKDFLITSPAAKKPLARVILEPKSKQTRQYLKQIELTFNTTELRLVQLLVRQGDGGTQTMDFNEPKRMTTADRAMVPPPTPK